MVMSPNVLEEGGTVYASLLEAGSDEPLRDCSRRVSANKGGFRSTLSFKGSTPHCFRLGPTVALNTGPPRKADGERRAFLRRRGDLYRPRVGDDYLAHDVQAQPDAARNPLLFRFCCHATHEGIEDSRQQVRWDRRAFILHAQHHRRFF
jgi:hypothetical protein